MAELSVKKVAELLGTRSLSNSPVLGFEVDSRKILPGFVFWALQGELVDGHDFLEEVCFKGAVLAVVSKSYDKEISGLELIRVDNVLESLHKVASHRMEIGNMRCIAVTGSVGKTTTKEFIATILEGAFSVGKTPGNANSQVGLPLGILNMKGSPEIFVAEMGMSQKGEIESLLSIAPPDIAVVTKVALAHAINFPGGLEEVAMAKAEILLHSKTKKSFLNDQVRSFAAFQNIKGHKPIFYGVDGQDAVLLKTEEGFAIRTLEGMTREFSLPFKALHLAENFLAAALVARELGMEWDSIFERAKYLTSYKMRFEKVEKDGIIYINDAYNANPESMKAALENLPSPAAGRNVIAVLGEMRELGIFSKKAHEEVGQIASLHADVLFCLEGDALYMSEEFIKSGRPSFYFSSLPELKIALMNYIQRGDVVLLKASNSLKMWKILDS